MKRTFFQDAQLFGNGLPKLTVPVVLVGLGFIFDGIMRNGQICYLQMSPDSTCPTVTEESACCVVRVNAMPTQLSWKMNVSEVGRLWYGGVSEHHRTPLYRVDGNLTGARYRDEILRLLVILALQAIGANAVLMDTAPCHRSRIVNIFVQNNNVTRMVCPAM